jgi:predicted Mrr-cat superfamily restriction endonuclease
MKESENSGRVWVVRAGRNAAYASQFLVEARVAIGFDLNESIEGLTWEDISERVTKNMADSSPVAVGLAVGALFRLANEFEVGDYVLTPEAGGNILAGEVTGSYEFNPEPAYEDYCHTRPVRWFARFPRSTLAEDMRRTLGSIMTLFLPGFQKELVEKLDALRDGPVPGPSPVVRAEPSANPTTVTALPESMVDPPAPAGGQFEPGLPSVEYLLQQIHNRDLALPDFQRSFV